MHEPQIMCGKSYCIYILQWSFIGREDWIARLVLPVYARVASCCAIGAYWVSLIALDSTTFARFAASANLSVFGYSSVLRRLRHGGWPTVFNLVVRDLPRGVVAGSRQYWDDLAKSWLRTSVRFPSRNELLTTSGLRSGYRHSKANDEKTRI